MNRHIATLILLVCVPLASSAAAGDNRLTVDDVFEIETVGSPQISPDGSRVVFVRNVPDIMTDHFYSNLWIVGTDGSNQRPITTGKNNDGSPRWSPSGDRIAYVSTKDGAAQIWVRYMDTGQTTRITHLQTTPSGLSWSPDGGWLAFAALVSKAPPEIARMTPKPDGAQWDEPAKVIDTLVYRFDPVGNLPRGNWHYFVVPAAGGTARQITSGDISFAGPGLRNSGSGPVWTRDGAHLLVSANLRPEGDLEPLDTEVYDISIADGSYRALTSRHGPDNGVALSRDGSRIAYTGFEDLYQGFQTTHLFVANRDGSNPQRVPMTLNRSVASPTWSADGESIYVTYVSEGRGRLARVGKDGHVTELAADIGGGVSAYSGGSAFTVARDGRFAVVDARPDRPGEIAVGSGTGGLKVLTSGNEDVLGHKDLAELEEIWYESSHDGRRVQGWILKPPGFDPARQYPLILEIHGGPFAAYGPNFDLEKQLMAAAGYVVLYTNPRGSTSYGREFGNLIHHAYPGDDFYDLMSGVDAVIARGYVDPDQLNVTGGSGGGVLTSWVIGRSDRFRSAVTVYPVINWYSWVLTSDIAAFGVKYWFPGLPWDNVEHYEKRSLLSVVKNVKTPTMVLTGEADYRTPMSQSEQYFTALKLLSVETVLVRVPNESHGIRRRPSHWMQKIAHIVGWMDKHRDTEQAEAPTGF